MLVKVPQQSRQSLLNQPVTLNQLLLWLNLADMPTYGQPGAGQPQQHGRSQQRQTIDNRHAAQHKVTLIETGHFAYSDIQPAQTGNQKQPGQHSGQYAVIDPKVQEGTTHEGIGAAHQFHYQDLLAATLDRQADGVGHDQQQGDDQQYRQPAGEALEHLQHRGQPLDPQQVDLHLVDAGQLCQLITQWPQGRGAAFDTLGHHQYHVRQRVVGQLLQGLAQPGVLLEFCQRQFLVQQLGARHTGQLVDPALQLPGFGGIHLVFKVDRQLGRALPVDAQLLDLVDQHRQPHGQGQHYAHHQHYHQGAEGGIGNPVQCQAGAVPVAVGPAAQRVAPAVPGAGRTAGGLALALVSCLVLVLIGGHLSSRPPAVALR